MLPGIAYPESAWLHVRHAVLSLRRSWRFSLVVTLVLAIGIGGATVVYGVAEGLLFRPIPYSAPENLHVVSTVYSTGGSQGSVSHTVLQWELFERLTAGQTLLDGVAAYSERGANVAGDGWSERLQVAAVTRSFLPLVGVQPSCGRRFLEVEFKPEENHVALLTHSLWRRRFGSDPAAVGRTILLNDRPYTVVGVLSSDFRSIGELETGIPAWFEGGLGVLVPLVGDPTMTSSAHSNATQSLRILARLSERRRLGAARRELALLSARFSRTLRGVTTSYTLTPLSDALSSGVPERLALLAAAVAVLLLVACANGALLMVQRRESRRREIEIRAALGATPRRLAAEGLVEAMLLGVSACAVGVAIAWGALRATRTMGGAALTGLGSVQITWSAVAFAITTSLGAAVLAGLVPFAQLLRDDVARSWPRVPGTSQSRPASGEPPSWMVVAQVGLSVALVVVTAMLAADFSRRAALDIGYQAEGVLSAQVAVSGARHPDGGRQFYDSLVRRLRELPGVEGAALVFPNLAMPMAGAFSGRVDGFGDEILGFRVASPSLFSLLRVPLLAGRMLTEAEEHGGEPLIVVNNAFAERYWGSARAAMGKIVHYGLSPKGEPGPPATVIGVVRDMANAFRQAPPEIYFTPAWTLRTVGRLNEATLLVRAADTNVRGLAARVERLAQEVDPHQPLFNVRPLQDLVRVGLARTRLLLMLVAAFSALATLFAGVGVYVILAFSVGRRTAEFGIRLALGAPRRDVLLRVLGRTLGLVAKGVALTLPLTYGVMWLLAAQLFGVTDTDPITCVWAVGVTLAAALLASLGPAWRATRVDPTTALRQE